MEAVHYLWGAFVGTSMNAILIREFLKGIDPNTPPLRGSQVLQRFISAVGGVVGVFLVNQFFPKEISLITASLGAAVFGLIFVDLYNLIVPRRNVS